MLQELYQKLYIYLLKNNYKFILKIIYFCELIIYHLYGMKKFLLNRQKLFGNRFIALGRIIECEHKNVVKLLNDTQERTSLIGSLYCNRKYFPDKFLLFMDSNEKYENIKNFFAIHFFNNKKVKPLGIIKDTSDENLKKILIKSIHNTLFDYNLSEEQVNTFYNLANQFNRIHFSLLPEKINNLFLKKEIQKEKDFIKLYENFYIENDLGIDKNEFAELVYLMILIAGYFGASKLLLSVINNLEFYKDSFDSTNYILECARLNPSVDFVNTVLKEDTILMINGKQHLFKKGTVHSACLTLANLDKNMYIEPEKFNSSRHYSQFVGFSKNRYCLGKNISIEICKEIIYGITINNLLN